jgi:hypothetical protein
LYKKEVGGFFIRLGCTGLAYFLFVFILSFSVAPLKDAFWLSLFYMFAGLAVAGWKGVLLLPAVSFLFGQLTDRLLRMVSASRALRLGVYVLADLFPGTLLSFIFYSWNSFFLYQRTHHHRTVYDHWPNINPTAVLENRDAGGGLNLGEVYV